MLGLFDSFYCPNCNQSIPISQADEHMAACMKSIQNKELFPQANPQNRGHQDQKRNNYIRHAKQYGANMDYPEEGQGDDMEYDSEDEVDLAPVAPPQADPENFGECPICLKTMFKSENLVRLDPCGHQFHQECYLAWRKKSNRCPFCKHVVNKVMQINWRN